MIKYLIHVGSLTLLILGSTANAKTPYIGELQKLNRDYLVCNNTYTNTGSLTAYQRCLESNFNDYDSLIKSIRADNNYDKKDNWSVINNRIITHNILCKENLDKSPNISIHKEISLCNHLMYKSLATEAIGINQN